MSIATVTLAAAGGLLGLGVIATYCPALIIRARQRAALREQCRGRLALTYDDGPEPRLTPALLALLAERGVAATFFLVGFRAERHPELCDRIVQAGHELGCHTFDHRNAWKRLPWRAVADVARGYRGMARWLGGTAPFRPPFGKLTTWTWLATRRRGAPLAWWTRDARDQAPTRPSAAEVVNDVIDAGGGVVLMHFHDSGPQREAYVLDVTRRLLDAAAVAGLEVCTWSQLTAAPAARERRRMIVETVDPRDWDTLITAFPEHSVFHTMPWLAMLARVHGLEIILQQARDERGVTAAWPMLALRKGPFRIVGSPLPGWSTAYMGPLVASRAEPLDVIEPLLEARGIGRWSYLQCRLFDRDRAIDLTSLGFRALRREETYLLDLERSEETLWSNLRSQCRRQIRKAGKLGVEVIVETGDDWLEDFQAMSGEVFSRSGIQPTYTAALVRELHRELTAAGRLLVISGMLAGRRIATLVLPLDMHTMYYWAGASWNECRDVPVNNLLHWEAIRHARAAGLRTYDFINTKGGPGRFKKTFGPEAVEVATHWEASRTWWIGWLKRKYEARARKRRRVAA